MIHSVFERGGPNLSRNKESIFSRPPKKREGIEYIREGEAYFHGEKSWVIGFFLLLLFFHCAPREEEKKV